MSGTFIKISHVQISVFSSLVRTRWCSFKPWAQSHCPSSKLHQMFDRVSHLTTPYLSPSHLYRVI